MAMDPDERDRLSRLEVRFETLEKEIEFLDRDVKERLDRVTESLDEIKELVSISKGARYTMQWLASIAVALAAAGAWFYDRFPVLK